MYPEFVWYRIASSCFSQLHVHRTIEVYPRRNPSRKARPAHSAEDGAQRITRSMTKTQNATLMDGLEDEQKVKRVVYRTV